MAFYSIGEVAERCGINPVTLRAWQRRYGLLKPQRSEGGHRQFDEEDILRIEEIKRWIERGVSVGKVKALLEDKPAGGARRIRASSGRDDVHSALYAARQNPRQINGAQSSTPRRHPHR